MRRTGPDGLDSLHDFEADFVENREKTDLVKELKILSDYFNEKELEAKQLRRQLSTVLDEFDRLQGQLVDARLIISDQQCQLGYFRHEAALNKTKYEDLKIQNLVQSSSPKECSPDMEVLIKEYFKLVEELEHLLDENKKSKEGIKHSNKKCELKQKLLTDEIVPEDRFDKLCENHEEVIESLKKEKERWEKYALTLVANISKVDPDLLQIKTDCESENLSCSSEERVWYNYAMRLLSTAVSLDVNMISEIDMNLLETINRSKSVKKSIGCEAVGIETANATAQTKRSLFDRLKKYFHR